MIVHSYYDEDPRVRREAESLVAAGRVVIVIGLRRPGEPARGELAGVLVRRLDVQRHQGAGLLTYLREYLSFGVRAAWLAARLHRRTRFGLLQVHSLPDFLAFAALPLRLVGVPLLLDLHEAMPEFFQSRFPRAANPRLRWLLLLQERLSIAFSSHTITVNDAMRDRLVRLGVPAHKVSVVINSPVLDRFDPGRHPHRPFAVDGVVRLIYTGGLTPTYELDVALRAVARLAAGRPDLDVRLDVFGRGDSEPLLHRLATQLGIAERVVFHGRVPLEAIPTAVAMADIGLAPTRLDAYTGLTLSTKVYEYAAMGKPVVATRLPMLERTFPDGAVQTYASGDHVGMAAALGRLIDDADMRSAGVQRAREIVEAAAWERESVRYVARIDRHIRNGRPLVAAQTTPSR